MGLGSAEQTVDDSTSAQELCDGGQRCRLTCCRRLVQVGPGRRHTGAGPIRQDEDEQQISIEALPAEDLQLTALERVPGPDDGHPLRVAVEMVVVGIVSCVPSTRSTMGTCASFSTDGYAMAC